MSTTSPGCTRACSKSRRHARNPNARRFVIAHMCRHRRNMLRFAHRFTCIGSRHTAIAPNALSNVQVRPLHLRANLKNLPASIKPRRVRQCRQNAITPATYVRVHRVHPSTQHLKPHLTRGQPWSISLFLNFQNGAIAKTVDSDRSLHKAMSISACALRHKSVEFDSHFEFLAMKR
jgi:hypothetical protein